MAKINLRESLGRLDLLTDNKYDLRNTYDCSNISNNKKKVLAEAISNNVSAKQLYNILNEDYDSRYEANSYYGKNYSGLEDNLYTDSYSELEEWVWEKIHGGGYIEVSDRETGKYVRLNPDRYDFESDDAYGVLDDLSKINESLNESEEQLYKVVLSSGATKFNFESALYKDEAEGIVDYYDGRWIDENGFEWDMYVEEDDESTEHAMVDDSYDMEESYFAPDGDSVEDMVTTGSGYGEALKNAKKWCDRYKEDYIIIFYGFPFGYLTVSENNYNNYPDEYSGGKIVARVKYEDGKSSVYKECLTEASYGGAYDIEDDMFFTKEEIVELADEVCDLLKNKFGYDYETVDVGMESTTELYLCVQDIHGVEEESTFRIDMRKIRKPSDLFKYAKPIAGRLAEKFEDEYQYYNFDESLTEDTVKQNGKWVNKGKEGTHGEFKTKKAADQQRKAMYAQGFKGECLEESDNDENSEDEVAVFTKGIDGKSYYHGFMNKKEADKHYPDRLKEAIDDEIDFETDLDDGEVEEGNVFFADGTDWVWEERIAGPIHLDFDNWAVWSARESVDIRDFIIGKNDNGGWDIDKEAYIKAVKSKPIVYFIVDEDTGFIDWGPVENEIEAKDFLNSKQDDWENDDYYGESLKEDFDDSTTFEIYYDDIDGEKADYYFEVPYIDVLEFLANYAEDEEDAPQDEEELLKYIDKNFDRLYNEYEYKVLDHFYEDAEMKYQSDMADRAEYMRDTMRDRDI